VDRASEMAGHPQRDAESIPGARGRAEGNLRIDANQAMFIFGRTIFAGAVIWRESRNRRPGSKRLMSKSRSPIARRHGREGSRTLEELSRGQNFSEKCQRGYKSKNWRNCRENSRASADTPPRASALRINRDVPGNKHRELE